MDSVHCAMKVASLFSGCGGLDLGFQQAGHEIVFAIDNDNNCCQTYKVNISNAIVQSNVRDITFVPTCDIIIGGPPCQQFSIAARRYKRREFKKQPAILEFARIVLINKPRYFLMENVPGLLHPQHADVFQLFLKRMVDAEFTVAVRKLDAANFGVPQHRKRLFVYGGFDSIPLPPPITHGFELFGKPYVTVNDALGWSQTRTISHNRSRPGLPSYKYYCSDRPARTMTTLGHSIISPLPRMMTARESAKLQAFPDWFEFSGNVTARRRMIGNAVPPLMAQRIAECFYVELDSCTRC